MRILLLDIEFFPIPGREGYFISRCGKVLSCKRRKKYLLKTHVGQCGYLKVKVQNYSEKLHRLLGFTFIPNPAGKSDINHKDGNKLNNELSNLEWVSRSENLHHAILNGLHDKEYVPVRGIHLTTGQILEFPSQAEAGRSGFIQGNIARCLTGERHSHRGYRWERA